MKRHQSKRKASKEIEKTEAALRKLQRAVSIGKTKPYCLKLWGNFIRQRDGHRCVSCHRKKRRLSAHHILRKCLFIEATFLTGNGITLCEACHKEPHKIFNRKPDLQLPMDAEGGEQIEILTALLRLLLIDAKNRHLLRDDFYYFTDRILAKFKICQGFDPFFPFPGYRLEQAFSIWRQTPRTVVNAILEANGVRLPERFIQPAGAMTLVWFDDEAGTTELFASRDPADPT